MMLQYVICMELTVFHVLRNEEGCMNLKRGDSVIVNSIRCVVMAIGKTYALVVSSKANSYPTWVLLTTIASIQHEA